MQNISHHSIHHQLFLVPCSRHSPLQNETLFGIAKNAIANQSFQILQTVRCSATEQPVIHQFLLLLPPQMASFVHKLAKNAPALRTVSSFKSHLFPKPTASLISHHSHLGAPKPEFSEDPVDQLGPASFHNAESPNPFPIFPNFPFGFCLNPISPAGFDRLGVLEAVEVESDDVRTIWADSVKKKRKKKMNKHKLKKLRKSLCRKSRA